MHDIIVALSALEVARRQVGERCRPRDTGKAATHTARCQLVERREAVQQNSAVGQLRNCLEANMHDTIVRIARTIACPARLRILSCLVRSHETTPTSLARELRIPLAMVCTHLRRLSAAGLIQRRRSGSRCYCIAQSPYGKKTLSGSITSWLREILPDPARTMKNSAVGQLRNSRKGSAESQLHALVFEAATAFTNHRRLQILRRLARGDVPSARTLTKQLHMSEAALSRHASKLRRRGYVNVCRDCRSLRYRLTSKFKTPAHATMFEIVREHWSKR